MLLSEDKLFLFVHVPKTGGTSIEAILRPYSLARPNSSIATLLRSLGFGRDHRRFRFPQHTALSRVQARIPDELYDRCFKFAFVRNPWDKLAADYNHARSNPGSRRQRRLAGLEFSEFLKHEARRTESRQVPLLLDKSGQIGLDFLGRFETYASDAQTVLDRLGVDAKLPHKNAHPHGDYRGFYDHRTRRFVAEHWAEDAARLGYSFDEIP